MVEHHRYAIEVEGKVLDCCLCQWYAGKFVLERYVAMGIFRFTKAGLRQTIRRVGLNYIVVRVPDKHYKLYKPLLLTVLEWRCMPASSRDGKWLKKVFRRLDNLKEVDWMSPKRGKEKKTMESYKFKKERHESKHFKEGGEEPALIRRVES